MSESGQEYDLLVQRIVKRFAQVEDTQLFTTSIGGEALWQTYLNSFPAADRQFHNCNACRKFIERFGSLVTIDYQGNTHPVAFDPADWEGGQALVYQKGLRAMHRLVQGARVTGVFYCDAHIWGTPSSMISADGRFWAHYYLRPHRSRVFNKTTKTADQVMASKREDMKNIMTALHEFPKPLVDNAVALLSTHSAYRSDTVLGPAKFLQQLHEYRRLAPANRTHNLTWLAVASAPEGFLHPRASMIGTLLEDLHAGMAGATVIRRFEEKMSPSVYQRPTAAPTVGAVQQAERLVQSMGLAKSLERRFARLANFGPGAPVVWSPAVVKTPAAQGVFGNIRAKGRASVVANVSAPEQKITWEKFARTVIPVAQTLEVKVPETDNRFAALVAPVDFEAPPILKWDEPKDRNPFSWFYASGVDAEIRRRLTKAGAKFENCDIRASLIWHDRNDLDLNCKTPSGQIIYFGNKRADEGWLDVDMNVCGETREPVENIRWAKGTAPEGRYQFWVDIYAYHEYEFLGRARPPTPFRVELDVNGELFTFDGNAITVGQRVLVADFNYSASLKTLLRTNMLVAQSAQCRVTGQLWGVQPNTYVKVTCIVPSPNMWGRNLAESIHATGGRHMFFLLEGCKPSDEAVGRGLYPEMLRSELREVRSTLEAYAADQKVQGLDDANACGLGFSDQADWNVHVRATLSDGVVANYVIDRWD
jgi:hypothetical protein